MKHEYTFEELAELRKIYDESGEAGLDITEMRALRKAGPLTVKIHKGKRNLDAKAFEKHFPIQQHADCYQVKPKALSAIIKLVGENALQDCVKVGAASLVVE